MPSNELSHSKVKSNLWFYALKLLFDQAALNYSMSVHKHFILESKKERVTGGTKPRLIYRFVTVQPATLL